MAHSDPMRYGFSALTPFAKYPLEKGLGFNTYTGKDFDPTLPWYNPQNSAESNLIVGRTGEMLGRFRMFTKIGMPGNRG